MRALARGRRATASRSTAAPAAALPATLPPCLPVPRRASGLLAAAGRTSPFAMREWGAGRPPGRGRAHVGGAIGGPYLPSYPARWGLAKSAGPSMRCKAQPGPCPGQPSLSQPPGKRRPDATREAPRHSANQRSQASGPSAAYRLCVSARHFQSWAAAAQAQASIWRRRMDASDGRAVGPGVHASEQRAAEEVIRSLRPRFRRPPIPPRHLVRRGTGSMPPPE
jgi:hypothetical protein